MEQLSIFTLGSEQSTLSAICDKFGCDKNTPAWPDMFGRAIKQYLVDNRIPSIRTLSLFSGAGGLDIGFHDVGFEIVESVEIESKFCKTLELNSGKGKRFENSKVNCIDINEYTPHHLGNIDFIIGGPPCQTFSAAGRRANGVLGTTDARGILFKEYVRLLKELEPVGFLFENVYGIIGAQRGEAWKEILKSFSEVGYRLYYRIVDAADYGVPQHRERLIIVGLKEGKFQFPRPTHGPDSIDDEPFYNAETAVMGVALTEEESKSGIGGRYGALLDDIPPGLNYSFYTEEMGHPTPIFAWRSKFSDFLYKADPNQPVRTIKASGGAYTGPFHWENRFFAYSEYKRLQTFPDDYEISGSKQIAVKQIGNSVPPQLARMMALAIRQQVFKTQFPFKLSLLEEGEELTFRKRKRALTAIYQKKARMAIAAIRENHVVLPDSHEYFCILTENFYFKKTEKDEASFSIRVNWGDKLVIMVRSLKDSVSDCKMLINIKPNVVNWNLDISSVELWIYSEEAGAFTVAWKAFEHELIINSIKADLVQLNGYYQYVPKIKCECQINAEFKYAAIIKKMVEGQHVTEMISSHDLSSCWEVPEYKLADVAEFLRSIGYEIRNNSTNPQIQEGYWLVPYAFPTLTPQSVQLRKRVK
ncbi:MAG: DNA cytosine methyltransferase [Lachnospiraceae bacterium]|nr:DNA cytosine methyltransferase [Lachnospiraceae bacterium]